MSHYCTIRCRVIRSFTFLDSKALSLGGLAGPDAFGPQPEKHRPKKVLRPGRAASSSIFFLAQPGLDRQRKHEKNMKKTKQYKTWKHNKTDTSTWRKLQLAPSSGPRIRDILNGRDLSQTSQLIDFPLLFSSFQGESPLSPKPARLPATSPGTPANALISIDIGHS